MVKIAMKLRLERAPLTDEDFDIYIRMAGRVRPKSMSYYVLSSYDMVDRRDADLMLFLLRYRDLGLEAQLPKFPAAWVSIAFSVDAGRC